MSEQWCERFKAKIVPATKALEKIRPGDRVFIGSACGEPRALIRAMVEMGGKLADTELIHVLTLGVAPYTDPKYAPNFRANAFFIGNSVRDAVNTARADYTPIFLSQVPELFKSRRVNIDVGLIMVSPPDDHGFCSLGVSVDITKSAAASATILIAQVNDQMPRTLGDSFVHVDQIHYLVEHNEPLLEWPATDPTDQTTQQIAEHVARLVPNGSTLQLGIGRIPDAVLGMLTEKSDLGIHTEMFSDGVVKLVRAGVVTGKYKTLHTGKIVGSFAAGTKELFDFIDNNPQIEMHPSEYTNAPLTISRHDNMVAINAALEVDLTGQVCADSLGQQFYSGIGGHADFIRGAALARNGKPIIAMPSTAETKDGTVSRITPVLSEGAGVVTTRGDVHYVVTEHGVAYLHGKTMRERAMSLINIAHPRFRAELLHMAKRRRVVYLDQILPIAGPQAPREFTTTVTLSDGDEVTLRPIRPDDEPLIKEMFYSFSRQTMYLRFHGSIRAMPHQRLQVFCNVDFDTEVALVCERGPSDHREIIGVGRYFADPSQLEAEMAFAVRDDCQRKGLGTILFTRLVEIARARGITRFSADVLIENSGMLKIFHRSGMNIETTTDAGAVHVVMTVIDDAPEEQN